MVAPSVCQLKVPRIVSRPPFFAGSMDTTVIPCLPHDLQARHPCATASIDPCANSWPRSPDTDSRRPPCHRRCGRSQRQLDATVRELAAHVGTSGRPAGCPGGSDAVPSNSLPSFNRTCISSAPARSPSPPGVVTTSILNIRSCGTGRTDRVVGKAREPRVTVHQGGTVSQRASGHTPSHPTRTPPSVDSRLQAEFSSSPGWQPRGLTTTRSRCG
jgi:hypothetical protein